MISVIVYGRNDSHGYNLQQRATLSLNSIAQALTHPDDEIIFVDWNSELGLPAFPVTIDDVLTDHCKNILRIIQVPSTLHREFNNGRTQKPTIEPVARNVGIRRSNSRNPWILSTNTDVLLKVQSGSLSAVAEDLPGHYYATPRFEIPEWIWESLPRHDPAEASSLLESHLNGVLPRSVVRSSHENMFDAPGDFQLVRRDLLESIGCFDETMILGWHVDSNLAVRMARAFGEPMNLEHEVQVFHCNHTRQTTHFHNREVTVNSLTTYVSGEVFPEAKSGKFDWGMPNANLQVENLNQRAERLKGLSGSSDATAMTRHDFDFMDERDRLAGVPAGVTYPFLVDQLIACSRGTLVYLGGRPDMVDLLRAACRILDINFCDSSNIAGLHSMESPLLVILDLVPPREVFSRQAHNIVELCDEDKQDLFQAFTHFRKLLLESDLTFERFIFINAEANEFEHSLAPFFHMLPSQFYSRMRTGNLKVEIPRDLHATDSGTTADKSALMRVVSLLSSSRSWARRNVNTHPRLRKLLSPIIAAINWSVRQITPLINRKRQMIMRDHFLMIPEDLVFAGSDLSHKVTAQTRKG